MSQQVVKQQNTRLARGLVRFAAFLNVAVLLMLCPMASESSGAVVVLLLLALLVDSAVGVYAVSQGLVFEWLMERKWKAVCQGIGFVGEGRLQFKTRVAFDPISSIEKGHWERKTIYPKLRNVRRVTPDSWTGTVYPLFGQTLEQYNDAAPAFALAFNAKFCGFERTENGLLRIRVGEVPVPGAYSYGSLPQSAPQPAHESQTANFGQSVQTTTLHNQNVVRQVEPTVYVAQEPDYRTANMWADEMALLRAVPMARDIDGNVWYMPIEEQHVLIAAATGCGKGSWIYSLVFGLVPAWKAGLVEFWGIDPKMNELAMGRDFFKCYADNDADSVVLLEECVKLMNERGRAMQGIRRKFVPSLETPLVILVIDEMGYMSALLPDKKLRDRANMAITALLVRGRSPGIAVVSAVQDPRKSVVDNRDLYTIRIAGRMPAPMCDLVLGEGMSEVARTDQIPPPYAGGSGVAYVLDVMTMEPRLVRAAWCSDDDIRGMMKGVLRPKPKPVLDAGGAAQVKDEPPGRQFKPLPNWQYRVD